jgi:hypothetical protein
VPRRLGAERGGGSGQPLGDGRWEVVDDVVDAGPAAFDRRDRRVGAVLDVHERPNARTVADDRELARPDRLGLNTAGLHGGPRSVEAAVAQHDAVGPVGAEHSGFEMPHRTGACAQGVDRRVGDRVVLRHQTRRVADGRPRAVALRDEALHADGPAGREQVIGALGSQAVGLLEGLVEVAQVQVSAQGGQLMDDDLGLGLRHRTRDRVGVERVGDHRLRAELADDVLLGWRPRHADHVMAARDEPLDQRPAECSGCSRDQDLHGVSSHCLQ